MYENKNNANNIDANNTDNTKTTNNTNNIYGSENNATTGSNTDNNTYINGTGTNTYYNDNDNNNDDNDNNNEDNDDYKDVHDDGDDDDDDDDGDDGNDGDDNNDDNDKITARKTDDSMGAQGIIVLIIDKMVVIQSTGDRGIPAFTNSSVAVGILSPTVDSWRWREHRLLDHGASQVWLPNIILDQGSKEGRTYIINKARHPWKNGSSE